MANVNFTKETDEWKMMRDFWEFMDKFGKVETSDEYWLDLTLSANKFEKKYENNPICKDLAKRLVLAYMENREFVYHKQADEKETLQTEVMDSNEEMQVKEMEENKKLWGQFSKKTNADAMLAKVKKAGFDAFITTKSGQAVSAEPAKKSVTEIAKEVIQGKWGNGSERKRKLTQAGSNYTEVQKKVNELLK